jgi:DNA-binding phage protein
MGERKGSGQGAILTEAQEALAMALAVEIGRRREATGHTVTTLARDAGIARHLLCYYGGTVGRPASLPNLLTLMRIASALGCRPSELLAAAEAAVSAVLEDGR